MKRLFLLLITVLCVLGVSAKARYIGKYKTVIKESSNGIVKADSCVNSSEFSVMVLDGKLKVSVYHEEITPTLEKQIKSAKAAAGWAAASAALSGVSSTVNAYRGRELHSRLDVMDMRSAVNGSTGANQVADNLQVLGAVIVLENVTDEELFVNDITSGLTWFIQPHSSVNIMIDDFSRYRTLRASTLKMAEQPISIVDIAALSETMRFDAVLEDDLYIYTKESGVAEDEYNRTTSTTIYYKVEKATTDSYPIGEEEYDAAKKAVKNSKKNN